MFRILVVQYKLVSAEYFMDKMQEWELYEFTNVIEYDNFISWQQTRLLMYIIAQVNSRKKLKLKDICTLPWEMEMEEEEHNIEMSNEDRDRLRKMAEDLTKKLAKQNA